MIAPGDSKPARPYASNPHDDKKVAWRCENLGNKTITSTVCSWQVGLVSKRFIRSLIIIFLLGEGGARASPHDCEFYRQDGHLKSLVMAMRPGLIRTPRRAEA